MTFGTDTACTPVTAVVRVALGVCAQQGNSNNDDYVNHRFYSMNYVLQTGTNGTLIQATYSDSTCTTPATSPYNDAPSFAVVSYAVGCGLLHVVGAYSVGTRSSLTLGANDDFNFPTTGTGVPGLGLPSLDSKYAIVTLDAGFNALPAAATVSGTWKAVSIYADGDACAQPETYAPAFFIARPVAVMDTCTVINGCTDLRFKYSYFSNWGATWTEGCVTVAPQTSGYMMVTEWVGGEVGEV